MTPSEIETLRASISDEALNGQPEHDAWTRIRNAVDAVLVGMLPAAEAMHTGQRARAGGWRWFARLSRNTDRQHTITNEIRRQVNVYLENPTEGW